MLRASDPARWLGPTAARFLALVLALLLAGAPDRPALAQAPVSLPILTLDRDGLYAGTLFGKRIDAELEAATTAMATETRKIEAALEAEEKDLTALRETLDAAAFRERAVAFDEKVQALRAERETAQANLAKQIEAARLEFFNRIGPVLGELVRERGGVMIIDRRAVLLAASDVDITAEAIARVDAAIGDGSAETQDSGGAAPETPADSPVPLDRIDAPAPEATTDPAQ